MSDNIIEDVELVRIRKVDGAQLYSWGDETGESLWLTGYNRASRVRVGDRGRLVYRTTCHTGLWWFEKYDVSN